MGWIFLEAVDNWFFRDGAPFEAGDDHSATTLFPPTARTVQGALRAKIWRRAQESTPPSSELLCMVGNPDDVGSISAFGGPFTARRSKRTGQVECYFTPPQDLVELVPAGDDLVSAPHRLVCAKPMPQGPDLPKLQSSIPGGLLSLWVQDTVFPARLSGDTYLVNDCVLQHALQGNINLNKGRLTSTASLFARERRAGNKLKKGSKNTEEGHLYEIELANPGRNGGWVTGLAVMCDGIDLPDDHDVVQLGGESRWAVSYAIPDGCRLPDPPSFQVDDHGKTRFKLYLATPCCLSGGWLPNWLSKTSCGLVGEHPDLPGHPLHLVAAAIAPKTGIGGFRLVSKQSRGTDAALGAGTVLFFETEAPPDEVVRLHGTYLREDTPLPQHENDTKLGFGLSFLGSW
ncbi:MAG: type III-B CRISPR module-associated Cmr3 family protein [Armatimonadia bacterium]